MSNVAQLDHEIGDLLVKIDETVRQRMSIRLGFQRRNRRDQRCKRNDDRCLLCHRLHQLWTASGSTFIGFNYRRLSHGHVLGNRNDVSGVDNNEILCSSTLRDRYRPPMDTSDNVLADVTV